MRGLSKAATLVLAPAAVLTRPVPTNPSLRDVPTESAFSVAVYVDTSASGHTGTTDQTLVFNLDIQEAPEACAPANVRIDGFLLAQDDTGAGQGTFASLDGHTVTASWNFSCSERTKTPRRRLPPWDQDLAFTIMSLDGEAVPATASFVTSFRQQAPVKVYDIGGDAVVYTTEGHAPSRQHQRRLLDRIKSITGLPEVDCETRADVGDIVSLETQMRDLGERIKVKQSRILDRLGIRVPTPTPALNMQGFYQTAKLASSTLRGTMEHWLGSVLGFPVLRYDDYRHRHHQPGQQLAHPEHRDDGLVVSMQVDGQGGQHFYYYRDEADSSSTRLTPTPPPRNVSYLPLFAIIFTFHLALYFVLRSIRQRTPSRCSSQQTPSSHHHRRSTQRQQRSSSSGGSSNEEQQQQSTASLLRESVRDLFRSRRNESEEVVDEKTRLRMMYEDEYNAATTTTTTTTTSMEDELASFQEAAELFGSVVAAQARPREEEGGDDDEDGRLPPRFAEDVSPPAYDEVHKGGVCGEEKAPGGC